MVKKSNLVKILGVTLLLSGTFATLLQPSLGQTVNDGANEQYQQELNQYRNARENFINSRERYRSLRNNKNKEELEKATRNYLEKVITSLIRRLERIKSWVSNRKSLTDEQKANIIEKINKDINWLNQQLDKISSAPLDELREEARIVLRYWKVHRIRVKRVIGEIWVARVEFEIKKAEETAEKVSKNIEDLKSQGKDTSQLEAWLNEFNQKIAIAKKKCEEAKAKFEEIKGEPGFDPVMEVVEAERLFREGHNLIVESVQYLKEAHKQLVQILKEIKNMGIKNIQGSSSNIE